MNESRENIDLRQEEHIDLERDTSDNNSSSNRTDSDSIPNRLSDEGVEDSISSEVVDQSSVTSQTRSNKTEVIYQLLDLGHVELLMREDENGRAAWTTYLESETTSQDVIDRFIEIGAVGILSSTRTRLGVV